MKFLEACRARVFMKEKKIHFLTSKTKSFDSNYPRTFLILSKNDFIGVVFIKKQNR